VNQEILEHLIELRKRLLYTIIGFLVVFLSIFHFANNIYLIISNPLLYYMPAGTKLIATDVTSPFFVPVKLTEIVAIFISLPNTIYQLWQFVAPGLYKHEKKLILVMIVAALALFLLGIVFAYFVVLPTLFNFINHFKAADISMLTDITKYLDLVLHLFVIFGFSFQMPIVIFLLIYFDVVHLETMIKMRKYYFVGSFIVAAIVTPPDVLSQTMFAIPFYLLYELGVLIAKLVLPPKIKAGEN
jgi:sec-independent protein translocase protein TatC